MAVKTLSGRFLEESEPGPASPSKSVSQKSMGRSNSDPDLLAGEDGSSLRRADRSKRSDRKLKTFHGTSSISRWDDVQISAKALAQLHENHEEWKKTVTRLKEDTSTAALEANFARNAGCWLAFGITPDKQEKAFSVRNFKAYPSSGSEAFRKWNGAIVNTKGQKSLGDKAIGQDNCSAATIADGWQVYCVMDGHGPVGHYPSTRTVQTIPYFLQTTGCATMLRQGQVESALIGCFKKAEADLEDRACKDNLDIQVSGCTAVCCCYHPNRDTVWVATAGDSRAVLLVPGKGCVKSTTDHKPSLEAEKIRIESLGGEIITTEYDDGWVEQRINLKGKEYPGISMTRSFGDLLVKDIGISADPTVEEWSLESYKNPYLFLACDGVWEFLENGTVADTLLGALEAGSTPKEACEKLLEKSKKAWKEAEGIYCDDISMVLKPLKTDYDLKSSKAGASSSGGDCCGGVQKSCTIL